MNYDLCADGASVNYFRDGEYDKASDVKSQKSPSAPSQIVLYVLTKTTSPLPCDAAPHQTTSKTPQVWAYCNKVFHAAPSAFSQSM